VRVYDLGGRSLNINRPGKPADDGESRCPRAAAFPLVPSHRHGALLPLGWRPLHLQSDTSGLPASSHVWLNAGSCRRTDHTCPYSAGIPESATRLRGVRARRGVAIELGGTLAVCNRSLASMQSRCRSRTRVWNAISELLAANGWDGMDRQATRIRLVVSALRLQRSVVPHAGGTATVVIQACPSAYHLPPRRNGLRLVTSVVRRDPNSRYRHQTTSARAGLRPTRGRKGGADDSIFLTTDGRLAEAPPQRAC